MLGFLQNQSCFHVMGGEDGCEGRFKAVIRTHLWKCLKIHLAGEINILWQVLMFLFPEKRPCIMLNQKM